MLTGWLIDDAAWHNANVWWRQTINAGGVHDVVHVQRAFTPEKVHVDGAN